MHSFSFLEYLYKTMGKDKEFFFGMIIATVKTK